MGRIDIIPNVSHIKEPLYKGGAKQGAWKYRKSPPMKLKQVTSGKILKGIVKRHPDGFGFVIPDDKNHQDIYIPASHIGSALTYDQVEVLVQKRRHQEMFFGSIKTILKRHWEWTSGPCETEDDKPLLRKHSLPIDQPVKAQNPHNLKIKKGEWVKVRLTGLSHQTSRLLPGGHCGEFGGHHLRRRG